MSEIKGFSPRQEKKAIKLHNDYVQRSREQEPGTVVGTRKAARHFRKNEQAYIEQAVLDAQQAGKEIDYPPYTPRRLPESDQVPEPQFKSDTAMYGERVLAAMPTPEKNNVTAIQPPGDVGSRTSN